MASVRFRHDIGDLRNDFVASSRGFRAPARQAVEATARGGWRTARRLSRRRAGPHGTNFYKRITMERTGTLEYEYGPTAPQGGEYVGVGYRTAGGNLDIPQSSDGLVQQLASRLDAAARGTWRV